MVLSHYGCNVELSELREEMSVGRDGASALTIVSAAEAHGLRCYGVKLDPESLGEIPLPAILHWNFNHFVVLARMRRGTATVLDPALGRRHVAWRELEEAFTGVAVICEPTKAIQRRPAKRHIAGALASAIVPFWKPLLALVGLTLTLQAVALAGPLLTRTVIDQVIPRSEHSLLMLCVAGLVAFLGALAICGWLRAIALSRFQVRVEESLLLEFVEHVFQLPYSFFQERSATDILLRVGSNRVVRDVVAQQILAMLADVCVISFYSAIILCVSAQLCLVVAVLGAAQLSAAILGVKMGHAAMVEEIDAESKSHSYLSDAIRGMETVLAAGASRSVLAHWRVLASRYLRAAYSRQRIAGTVAVVTAGLSVCAPVALLLAGAAKVMTGGMSLGTMLAFSALAGATLAPLGGVAANAGQLQLLAVHVRRVRDVMERPRVSHGARRCERIHGVFRLEDVSFEYDARSAPVLRHISMTIDAGSMVAIVGASGSGKSTLLKVLLGLHRPSSGRVFLDGQDLSEVDLDSARQHVGAVLQGGSVFQDTIRNNIALTERTLPLESVRRAARLAEVLDDIESLPLGFETPLAEMGTNVSGGQRQRICIARALVHSPAVVFLDEATSELDVITERRIQRNIEELRCTRVVVAHRLSTVVNADKIVVLENGTIVESGRHAELVGMGGTYARLVSESAKR